MEFTSGFKKEKSNNHDKKDDNYDDGNDDCCAAMAIEKNDKLNIASDTIYHNTASFSK